MRTLSRFGLEQHQKRERSRRISEYKICAQQRQIWPWLGRLPQTVHLNKYTQSNKIQNEENYLDILSGFDLSIIVFVIFSCFEIGIFS